MIYNFQWDLKLQILVFFYNLDEYTTSLKSPGPGTYEKYETVDKKGKLFLSKFRSSGCT